METLVVFAQQEQFNNSSRRCGRNNHHDSFRDINCRTFQSGSGLLPNPVKARSSPVTKHSLCNSTTPKTPNNVKKPVSDQKTKRITKSKSVPLPLDIKQKSGLNLNMNLMNDEYFCYSELWAGPAYSNSPPPSSLPMPKFSIMPKRTVSLDLPSVLVSDIHLLKPKSAPPSPSRDNGYGKSFCRDLFKNDDDDDEFATKTLRRILNLDE